MNNKEMIDMFEARALFGVMRECCESLVFTNDESEQILMICRKAMERERGGMRNERRSDKQKTPA